MTGIIVLILRLILILALYAFLGWALYLIWQELRARRLALNAMQVPPLTLLRLGENTYEPLEFNVPEIIIGRSAACEVVLADDTVSSRHARLSYHHSQWWIEDLHSTNGTFLNDERLHTPTVVVTGDDLVCGQIRVKITISSPS